MKHIGSCKYYSVLGAIEYCLFVFSIIQMSLLRCCYKKASISFILSNLFLWLDMIYISVWAVFFVLVTFFWRLRYKEKTWWKLVYVCFVSERRNYLIRLFIIMHQTYEEEKNVRKHLGNAFRILHNIAISSDLIFDAESSCCCTIYNQWWSPFFIYFIFDSEIFCLLCKETLITFRVYQTGYLM